MLAALKRHADIVKLASVRAVPAPGLVGATDSSHRELPAAGIGLELVASITMPSTAHLPMSELGDLSLPRGR